MSYIAMSEANAISSLISHCATCEAKCCKNAYVIHTEVEYQRITDADDRNVLTKVQIPEGNFYMLDFVGKSCRFLTDNGTCSIEAEKSDTCRAYPAKAIISRKGLMRGITFDAPQCPAVVHLTQVFKEEAIRLSEVHHSAIPWDIHQKILTQYQRDQARKRNAATAAAL